MCVQEEVRLQSWMMTPVERLLERVCDRDRGAFGTIYDRIKGDLFRYVLYQLRNRADAEEVFNDTMLAVWKDACAFRGDSSVATWIFAIGRNKCLERFRKNTHRPMFEDLDDYFPESERESFISKEASGFESIARSERADGIQACMGRLKPEFQEVLYLSLYQDLSYSEIAQIQNVSESVVKTRAFYARKKIRTCIERLLRSEGESVPGGTDGSTNY